MHVTLINIVHKTAKVLPQHIYALYLHSSQSGAYNKAAYTSTYRYSLSIFSLSHSWMLCVLPAAVFIIIIIIITTISSICRCTLFLPPHLHRTSTNPAHTIPYANEKLSMNTASLSLHSTIIIIIIIKSIILASVIECVCIVRPGQRHYHKYKWSDAMPFFTHQTVTADMRVYVLWIEYMLYWHSIDQAPGWKRNGTAVEHPVPFHFYIRFDDTQRWHSQPLSQYTHTHSPAAMDTRSPAHTLLVERQLRSLYTISIVVIITANTGTQCVRRVDLTKVVPLFVDAAAATVAISYIVSPVVVVGPPILCGTVIYTQCNILSVITVHDGNSVVSQHSLRFVANRRFIPNK